MNALGGEANQLEGDVTQGDVGGGFICFLS